MFDDCLARARALGVEVKVTRHLPGATQAAYDHAKATIWLSHRLPDHAIIPCLLHELEHAEAGHFGHQDAAVEDRINERVAEVLISAEDYARAEALAGGSSGGIAVELDLPRWVVSAYRRRLWAAGRDT